MHDQQAESRWRPVPGFDGYEVSDDGQVRSWLAPGGRFARGRKAPEPHLLTLTGDRYLGVVLCNSDGKKRRTVHQLVAELFIGPCPKGMEVRHFNGDAHDNRLANLRYGTPKENVADTVRHGTAWYLRPDVVRSRAVNWRRSMGLVYP